MKNIKDKVGLEVVLNDRNRLEFGKDVLHDGESIRKLSDLGIVAADKNLNLEETPAYFMYRNVRIGSDEEKIQKNDLRFDLTVIPPANLGSEFIKTSGHYHPMKPGTEVEYPELYYVISGQATYLMQKHEKDGSITDVIICRVKPGEAIMMPLNYGHVTINELDDTLVMANWVEKNFQSEYGDYETKMGAAYYLTSDGDLRKNLNYTDVAEIREMETAPMMLEDLKNVPIYDYVKSIEKIELIAKPEKYLKEFEIENLFR